VLKICEEKKKSSISGKSSSYENNSAPDKGVAIKHFDVIDEEDEEAYIEEIGLKEMKKVEEAKVTMKVLVDKKEK
jgi:hypothetical protein